MKSLWPGFFLMGAGDPALPGRVLTASINHRTIRGWSRVRAGRRRSFTPLPGTYGCNVGMRGHGGHQISRTPLTEPEPPHWEGRGPRSGIVEWHGEGPGAGLDPLPCLL
jgi:hypothetical protein